MSRISPVKPEEASGELKEIYDQLEKKMGRVLNIFLHMGNSPTTLKAFLQLSSATEHTLLPPLLREEIALVVGQANRCHYCLSAHTALATGLGLSAHDVLQVRQGLVADPKWQAILNFAKSMVEHRGNVSPHTLAQLKESGVSEQEMVEVILVVIVNLFTNYFNLITEPSIDFPLAQEIV